MSEGVGKSFWSCYFVCVSKTLHNKLVGVTLTKRFHQSDFGVLCMAVALVRILLDRCRTLDTLMYN